jgi:hypothetical protein
MYYCAHGIFYFKVDSQESFLVYENVYLIEAENDDLAMEIALAAAREDQDLGEGVGLELNEEKAQFVFAGIRKIISLGAGSGDVLRSGLELSYSVMEVDTLAEVESLARGEFVNVLYRE